MDFPSANIFGIAGLLLNAVVGAYASRKMMKGIEKHYPSLLNTIGRPDFFAEVSIRDQWRFHKFILRREYNSIPNQKIKRFGNITLLCDCMCVVIFAYLVFLHLR